MKSEGTEDTRVMEILRRKGAIAAETAQLADKQKELSAENKKLDAEMKELVGFTVAAPRRPRGATNGAAKEA